MYRIDSISFRQPLAPASKRYMRLASTYHRRVNNMINRAFSRIYNKVNWQLTRGPVCYELESVARGNDIYSTALSLKETAYTFLYGSQRFAFRACAWRFALSAWRFALRVSKKWAVLVTLIACIKSSERCFEHVAPSAIGFSSLKQNWAKQLQDLKAL